MTLPTFDYLLVKVASRCNIDCSYCYWFRDQTVYSQPKVMSPEVSERLLQRIAEQIESHHLKHFSVLLHGGEPLLWGKARFRAFAEAYLRIGAASGAQMHLSVTTNGLLIDDEWCELFSAFSTSVTVSIDGPPELHDKNRLTFDGRGTHSDVLQSIRLLRSKGIEPGLLSVADVGSTPDLVVQHLVHEVGAKHFDILIPDATYDNPAPSIATYYKRLFDLWLDELAPKGIGVRLARGIAVGLLGGDAKLESIGYGPIQTCAVMPDGSLEPLDVLRIAGNGSTKTGLNVFDHDIQAVTANDVWLKAFNASLNLPAKCKACEFRNACGGGYLPHRFSTENGYENPSVYCEDLIEVFEHSWQRIAAQVSLSGPGRASIPIASAIASLDNESSVSVTSH
jgi:uncharacterized protein